MILRARGCFKGFRQGHDMIRLVFLKDHSGFWVQKHWGAGINKSRKKVRKLLK